MAPLKFIFFFSVLLSGCGSNSEPNPSSQNSSETNAQLIATSELGVELTESHDLLAPSEQMVIDRVRNHEILDFDDLTKAVIDSHLRRLTRNSQSRGPRRQLQEERLMEELHNIFEGTKSAWRQRSPSDRTTLKTLYENRLALRPNGSVSFNSRSMNLFHLLDRHELQCHSGTVFHQVISRNVLGSAAFTATEPVIILQAGHILPGFFKKDGSNRWHLYGEETTFRGPALIYLGIADDLAAPLRILTPTDFFIAEVLRDYISNPAEFVAHALQRAASRYHLNLERLSSGIPVATNQNLLSRRGRPLNESLFAFGHGQRGNHERPVVESLSRSDTPFIDPGSLYLLTTPNANTSESANNGAFFTGGLTNCLDSSPGIRRVGRAWLSFSAASAPNERSSESAYYGQFSQYERQCQNQGRRWHFLALKIAEYPCTWHTDTIQAFQEMDLPEIQNSLPRINVEESVPANSLGATDQHLAASLVCIYL